MTTLLTRPVTRKAWSTARRYRGRIAAGLAVLLAYPFLLIGLLIYNSTLPSGQTTPGSSNGHGDMVQTAVGAANANGLPPAFFAAQMKAESNWNPYEVSPAGARGVAQIMPGEWTKYQTDGDGDGRTDPFDPFDSIVTGAKINAAYRAQVSGIPGDINDLTAAAYNAGVGAVRQYHGVPPYKETQGYLTHIHQYEPTVLTEHHPWPPAAAAGPGGGAAGLPDDTAGQAAAAALAQVGKPYVWGATGPDAFDCSGLVVWSYGQVGVRLPVRTAAEMRNTYPTIAPDQARPGDLVFSYPEGSDHHAGHVGIVLGGGYGVFAPQPGENVRVEKITPILSTLGYGRVTGVS